MPVAAGIPPHMVEDVIVLEYGNPKSLEIIEQMESHISEPLELVDIAENIDLSRRQVERRSDISAGKQ